MTTRGIGVEGVSSEIGALGRKSMKVDKEILISSLCRSFQASREEAENAINRALKVNAIKEVGNDICITVPKEIFDCPFCGSEDVGMNVMSELGKQVGYVSCFRCGAQGPVADFDEIVKNWNRRI